jgi:hypothetical protein
MFVLVIESLHVFITTVVLCVTVVTVWTFTFLKHYIMISCFVKDFTVHAHYKTVNTMKLSHKLSGAVCVTNQLPTLVCGLLSNSSVLLLGQAVLQCTERKSVGWSPTHRLASIYMLSLLEVDQNAFWLVCYHAVLYTSISCKLNSMVYKIIICLPCTLRTDLFSVSSLWLLAMNIYWKEQLQLCFFPSQYVSCNHWHLSSECGILI